MQIPYAARPTFSQPRLTAAQKRGVAYEAKVAAWLVARAAELGWTLDDHPWLRYGTGLCQPDFLLIAPSKCLIVIEAKLTECDCRSQLEKYKWALSGFSVTALQIAQRVTSRPNVRSLEETTDHGLMLLWL